MPSTSFQTVRIELRKLERDTRRRTLVLDQTKTEGGHLTDFGEDIIYVCRKHGMAQNAVAAMLDVSTTAVNRRYASPPRTIKA